MLLQLAARKPVNNISTVDALKKYELSLKDKAFIVFPEVRENPVRWFDSIPEIKVKETIHPSRFSLQARPGEYFVFQVGLWALSHDLKDVKVEFSDFKGRIGREVISTRFTCFNLGGINFRGNPFKKELNIPGGRVQALWIGADLDSIKSGIYKGSVTVIAGGEKQVVPLLLKVTGDPVSNHGYGEGARLTRLNWLNSTVGIDENVTKGFVPVKEEGNLITIPGRSVEIAENGFPRSILTFFGPSNQSLMDKGEPIVSHPFRFVIVKEDGAIVTLVPGNLAFTEKTESKVIWKVINTSADFDLELTGQMEFDGFIDYSLKLTAKNPVKVKDIRLEIPVDKEKAEYMMGLGHEGGFRTPDWKWKWDLSKNQDMLWLGSVNGGLRG